MLMNFHWSSELNPQIHFLWTPSANRTAKHKFSHDSGASEQGCSSQGACDLDTSSSYTLHLQPYLKPGLNMHPASIKCEIKSSSLLLMAV